MQIKFTATMPFKSPKYVKITLKKWKKLSKAKRYVVWHDSKFGYRNRYLKIVMIDNPAIPKMRKLLRKQGTSYTERNHNGCVIMETTDVRLK